jgi:hypothetical protein
LGNSLRGRRRELPAGRRDFFVSAGTRRVRQGSPIWAETHRPNPEDDPLQGFFVVGPRPEVDELAILGGCSHIGTDELEQFPAGDIAAALQ